MKKVFIIVCALWLVLGASSARADRVPAPPESCPEGAVGRSSHCGATCEPWTCARDADCQGGTCQERRLCLEEIECAHRGGSSKRTRVTGTCSDGASCPSGSCQTQRVCVPAARRTGAVDPGASGERTQEAAFGCRVTAGRVGAGVVEALALGLLLVASRRR